MADPVQEYNKFIDGLLGWPRTSVLARWVWEWDEGDKTYRPLLEDGRRLLQEHLQELTD